VGVLRGRHAGADVEELPDAGVADQVGDSPFEERTGRPRHYGDVGVETGELVADLAVDLEVVVAAEPVVPDPGRMWDVGLELGALVHQ
jgi:hypothetical protein